MRDVKINELKDLMDNRLGTPITCPHGQTPAEIVHCSADCAFYTAELYESGRHEGIGVCKCKDHVIGELVFSDGN